MMERAIEDIRYFLQGDLVFFIFFLYFSYAATLIAKKRIALYEKYSFWDILAGILFAYFCLGFTVLYMQFTGVDDSFILFFLVYHFNFFGIADHKYYTFRML
jgi:hypothetical protein